jgi:peptidylprolyl isomerase
MRAAICLALILTAGVAGKTLAAKPAPLATPPAPKPSEADWRTPDPQDVLVIETTQGRVIVELNDLAAPNNVERLRALTRAGAYDGRSFFRVLDNFMDQTGDPLDTGLGQSSLPNVKAEFTFRRGPDTPFGSVVKAGGREQGVVGSLPVISQTMDLGLLTIDHKVDAWGTFCGGVLGMARSDDPDSANSQFFFMRTNKTTPDQGTHQLDSTYTAAGRVIAGQEAIDAVKVGEPVPAPQDKMLSVKVLADMPPASRPKIRIVDANSNWFRTEVERQRTILGPDFSVCSIQLPVEIR